MSKHDSVSHGEPKIVSTVATESVHVKPQTPEQATERMDFMPEEDFKRALNIYYAKARLDDMDRRPSEEDVNLRISELDVYKMAEKDTKAWIETIPDHAQLMTRLYEEKAKILPAYPKSPVPFDHRWDYDEALRKKIRVHQQECEAIDTATIERFSKLSQPDQIKWVAREISLRAINPDHGENLVIRKIMRELNAKELDVLFAVMANERISKRTIAGSVNGKKLKELADVYVALKNTGSLQAMEVNSLDLRTVTESGMSEEEIMERVRSRTSESVKKAKALIACGALDVIGEAKLEKDRIETKK